jgi:hypothetical protein
MPRIQWQLDVSTSSARDVDNLLMAYPLVTGYPVVYEGDYLKGSASRLADIIGIVGVEWSQGKMSEEELDREFDMLIEQRASLDTKPADWDNMLYSQELEYQLWKVQQARAKLQGMTLIVD